MGRARPLRRYNALPEIDVNVYPSGSVFVSYPIVHTLQCRMDLSKFPFDVQTCTFTFGSWSYTGHQVDVKPRSKDGGGGDPFLSAMETEVFIQNKEFQLLSVKTRHCDFYYECCPEPYPIIIYSLELLRHPNAYVGGMILPLILTTYIGFLAFLLNPDAGERVSLGVTIVLAQVCVYFVAADALPNTDQWNLISNLYLVSLLFATLTLAISVVSVSMSLVKPSTGLTSEKVLLDAFVQADADASGDLDHDELLVAISRMGVDSAKTRQILKIIEESITHDEGRVSFPEWYEIVCKVQQSDGFASHHNHVAGSLLKRARRHEQARRVSVLRRRAQLFEHVTAMDGAPEVHVHDGGAPTAPDFTSFINPCANDDADDASSFVVPEPSEPEEDAKVPEPEEEEEAKPPAALQKLRTSLKTVAAVNELHSLTHRPSFEKMPTKEALGEAARALQHEHSEDSETPKTPRRRRVSTAGSRESARGSVAEEQKNVVTDHELADPTEMIGRKVAGMLDSTLGFVLSVSYGAVILIMLAQNHGFGVHDTVAEVNHIGKMGEFEECPPGN